MTKDQINLAIAESRGDITYCNESKTCGWFRKYNSFTSIRELLSMIEDYTIDLNAIVEATNELRKLTGSEWFDFTVQLLALCGSTANAINASALQRAIIYLNVLNKWVES
jgi:hypothetical protein